MAKKVFVSFWFLKNWMPVFRRHAFLPTLSYNVRFCLIYLPTQKSDILYERSLIHITLFVLLTGYWPKMENLKFWLWLVNLELEKLSLPNWSLSIWQLSTSLLQIWSLSKFLKLCPCWKVLAIPRPTEMTTHLGKY